MMNPIERDLNGCGNGDLAMRWLQNAWPSKSTTPNSYLIDLRLHREKMNDIKAIEGSIFEYIQVCVIAFVIWMVAAMIYATYIYEFPGYLFYLQNAICIAVCLITSGWVMKYFCHSKMKRELALHNMKLAERGLDKLNYEQDRDDFMDRFGTFIRKDMPIDVLPRVIRRYIVGAALSDARRIPVGVEDGNLLALQSARNLVNDWLPVAQKFGFCRRDTTDGIISLVSHLRDQKMV